VIPLTSSQNQLLAQLMDLHTDEIRSVLAKLGLDVDFALTLQENYSEKARKRAYWPRVQTAFREIAEDYREEYFAKLTEVLLDQKLSPEIPEITEVVRTTQVVPEVLSNRGCSRASGTEANERI
jgi:hypothetical protein